VHPQTSNNLLPVSRLAGSTPVPGADSSVSKHRMRGMHGVKSEVRVVGTHAYAHILPVQTFTPSVHLHAQSDATFTLIHILMRPAPLLLLLPGDAFF